MDRRGANLRQLVGQHGRGGGKRIDIFDVRLGEVLSESELSPGGRICRAASKANHTVDHAIRLHATRLAGHNHWRQNLLQIRQRQRQLKAIVRSNVLEHAQRNKQILRGHQHVLHEIEQITTIQFNLFDQQSVQQ